MLQVVRNVSLILASFFLVSACGGGGDGGPSVPETEVTNGSFTEIYKVEVGGVLFDEYLSGGCYSCATSFQTVDDGYNSINVYYIQYSDISDIIDPVGPFTAGKLHTVNIKKNAAGNYCAQLWTHNDPNKLYSVDPTGVLVDSNCMTTATLSGTYTANKITDASGTPVTSQITYTFDGVGNGGWTVESDSQGNSSSGSFTYSIADDGTVTLSTGDTGFVSTDGTVFMASDTDASDNSINMLVGMKQTSGLDDTILSGTYVANLAGVDATNGPWTSRIKYDFYGDGSVDWQILQDSTSPATLDSGTTTYSVASTGTFSLGTGETGIVSSDGETFTLADTVDGGGAVSLSFGVRVGGDDDHFLLGRYSLTRFGYDASDNAYASRLEYTFDHPDPADLTGTATWRILVDSTGATGSNSTAYTVDDNTSDPPMTVNFDDGNLGSFINFGNLVTIADTNTTGGITIVYGIRK